VTATQHNIGEKIDCLLAKAGAFFEADRAFAYFFDGKSQLLCCENAWYADEGGRIAVVDRQALTFAVGDHPWWVKQILEREVVHFSDLQKQPEYVVQGKCFLDENAGQCYASRSQGANRCKVFWLSSLLGAPDPGVMNI
jgi:hypothetical protein